MPEDRKEKSIQTENQAENRSSTKNPEKATNQGPPTIPPNFPSTARPTFIKRPTSNRTAPTTTWSKTHKTTQNPFGTPFNPADPFAHKPATNTYSSTPVFLNGKPNSTRQNRKLVKLTDEDLEDLCPFKRLQREQTKKKLEKRKKVEEKVEERVWTDEMEEKMKFYDKIFEEKQESVDRLTVIMEKEEEEREKKAKMEKKKKKGINDMLKVRPENRKQWKNNEIFDGNTSKIEGKVDVNGNFSFIPISTKSKRTTNENQENLENNTREELIEKVLNLNTQNTALEEILAQSNPNQEEMTNRKLKIKNKHVSTTLEEMNTAISMRGAAFNDINAHLANFELGFVDTAATYKRKSAGRGYAVLIIPNGGGSFQLNGKLSENNSYNPKNLTGKINRKPENTDATTQTEEKENPNENDDQDEKLSVLSEDDDKEVVSQKPVPDEFKD